MENLRKIVIGIMLVMLSLLPSFFHPAQSQTVNWNLPGAQVTNDPYYNARPDLVSRPDGSLVLVYSSTRGSDVNIYGRVYDPAKGAWSGEYQLTSNPNEDVAPALASFGNGTLLMVWMSNRTGTDDIMMARTDGTRTWGEQIIVGGPAQDSLPAVAISKYGIVWLFWVRFSSYTTDEDIYYKTLSGGRWSAETLYTSDGGLNQSPQAYATKDDRIWLVWSKVHGSDWDIWAVYNSNGQWGSRIQITQTNDNDYFPDITQDRAGNIWVFWSREIAYGSPGQGTFQQEIYATYSSDNGATWSSSNTVRITNDPSGAEKDDLRPAPAQAFDKTIWFAYASDPNVTIGNPYDIFVANSSQITGVHDVAITSLSPPSGAGQGANITISVGVKNNGDYVENNLVVSLYSTLKGVETLFGTKSVLSLAAGQSVQVPFLWNTKNAQTGTYTFRATINSVPGEVTANLGDNQLLSGTMVLTIPQDVNRDFVVDLNDLLLTWSHMFTKDLTYDVNFDGRVDLNDLISVYIHLYTNVPH